MRNLRLSYVTFGLFLAGCSSTITDGDGEDGSGGKGDDVGGPGDSDGDGNLPDEGSSEPVAVSGKRITWHEPARGQLIAAGDRAIEVRGQIDNYLNEPLVIEGVDVPVATDGTFETTVEAHDGLNVIELELGGLLGLRAARSFVYGDIAPADAEVAGAVALGINQAGMDDNEADLDDLASVIELTLSETDVMAALPPSYQIQAPVVGAVDIVLLEKSAGPPAVDLSPRAGGLVLSARLPNVRIRHDKSFNCAITTCRSTGTATAEAAVVTAFVDIGLSGDEIVAIPQDVQVDLVNFVNVEDGGVAQVVQQVLEFFIPDLVTRLENTIADSIAASLPDQLSAALSSFALPIAVDLPESELRLDVVQRLGEVTFTDRTGIIGLLANVSGPIEPGDPGEGALGWYRVGVAVGEYRPDPPFAISASIDLMNQLLFASWGQGALRMSFPTPPDLPLELGTLKVELAAAPILEPGDEGDLWLSAGDIMIQTEIDGVPSQIAISLKGQVDLVIAEDATSATIKLVGEPILWAELIDGPESLPGGLFATMVQEEAPKLITDAMIAATIPLPTLPLDQLSPVLAGKAFHMTPPADVVSDAPPHKMTIYGRFAAE